MSKLANADEYSAAIARVANSPKTASKRDWELTKKAAKQAGAVGNSASAALSGN